MRKNDLQTGMVLEFENGERAMVICSIYGDGIYYAGVAYGEHSSFNILTDDLCTIATPFGKVMRVLKAGNTLSKMRSDRMVATCKNATEVLWERTVYPKWFQGNDGAIVKFIGLQEGTVVVQGNGKDKVGFQFKSWAPHTATNIWTEIPEPVTEFTMAELEEVLGFKVKIIK